MISVKAILRMRIRMIIIRVTTAIGIHGIIIIIRITAMLIITIIVR